MTNTATNAVTNVETRGFYRGYNRGIAIAVKLIVVVLVLWAATAPNAAKALLALQAATIDHFGGWYVGSSALFMSACIALALIPGTGSKRLGREGSKPEFGRFAWFSMMFGAGIGVGMLTYSTAEPLYHFGNNPDVIMGNANALASNNVVYAYKWTLLHYGLTPWGLLRRGGVVTGLLLLSARYAINDSLTL